MKDLPDHPTCCRGGAGGGREDATRVPPALESTDALETLHRSLKTLHGALKDAPPMPDETFAPDRFFGDGDVGEVGGGGAAFPDGLDLEGFDSGDNLPLAEGKNGRRRQPRKQKQQEHHQQQWGKQPQQKQPQREQPQRQNNGESTRTDVLEDDGGEGGAGRLGKQRGKQPQQKQPQWEQPQRQNNGESTRPDMLEADGGGGGAGRLGNDGGVGKIGGATGGAVGPLDGLDLEGFDFDDGLLPMDGEAAWQRQQQHKKTQPQLQPEYHQQQHQKQQQHLQLQLQQQRQKGPPGSVILKADIRGEIGVDVLGLGGFDKGAPAMDRGPEGRQQQHRQDAANGSRSDGAGINGEEAASLDDLDLDRFDFDKGLPPLEGEPHQQHQQHWQRQRQRRNSHRPTGESRGGNNNVSDIGIAANELNEPLHGAELEGFDFDEGLHPLQGGPQQQQQQQQEEHESNQMSPGSVMLVPSPPPPPVLTEIRLPLRQWSRGETLAGGLAPHQRKLMLVRKTVVAYAIAEFLRRVVVTHDAQATEAATTIDNFVVRVSNDRDATIKGVDATSPPASLSVATPFFLSDDFWNSGGGRGQEEELGQFFEVVVLVRGVSGESDGSSGAGGLGVEEESAACHSLGRLVYELFSESNPFTAAGATSLGDEGDHRLVPGRRCDGHRVSASNKPKDESGPKRKKTFADLLSLSDRKDGTERPGRGGGLPTQYTPLKDLGFPASISHLVDDLIKSGWGEFRPDSAFSSLKEAGEDLHLLLLDPERFLFDRLPGKLRGAMPGAKGVDGTEGREASGAEGDGGEGGGASTNGNLLNDRRNKLYGRDAEQSAIYDAFCRVSTQGESEVFVVSGFSGSGKTVLVQSVTSYIDVSGGYVVHRKFDQISQGRPMSVVIAAFDDLCLLIGRKNSPEELATMVRELMAVFGLHLSALARLLPNISALSPELNRASSHQEQVSDLNLGSAHIILQLFLRVVTSKSHPLMLFLDDLHWADSASLTILHRVISDIKGCSSIFFVGNYRVNEASENHAIFALLRDLRACSVCVSTIHLDGIVHDDVNHMLSDTLGIVPRRCKTLSQLVLRRTKGNPLFVLECLKSMVEENLLKFSMREQQWVWDIEKISAGNIPDNVCDLLSTKMTCLPRTSRFALQVAACFGSNLGMDVVQALTSSSTNFSGLQQELERAVNEGFMEKDGSAQAYRFVHDRIREAAYGSIPEDERNEFHHTIGRSLLLGTQDNTSKKNDDMIFLIVDQINHCKKCTAKDSQTRIDIAQLNFRAASSAMRTSNFAAAYFYSRTAAKLLPSHPWEKHYELARNTFLVLGSGAYASGQLNEAIVVLEAIISHGKSLEDKLDAYLLSILLAIATQEPKKAYQMSLEVLQSLGEEIPGSINSVSFTAGVEKIKGKLHNLISMKTLSNPAYYTIMKFYNQALYVSYFVKPQMLKWYALRLLEISLEHGVCGYSAVGLSSYAIVLEGKAHTSQGGYELGTMALKLLQRFDATDLVPNVYQSFYSYTAVHREPFQSCADMLKRGFEIGLTTGDVQVALSNGIQYIQKSLLSGMNLSDLKKECDYQMRLIDKHSHIILMMYITAWQETIAMLMDKDESSNLIRSDDVSKVDEFSESLIFHGVLQHFWRGHYDRCLHYAEKQPPLSDVPKLKSIMTIFYGGLSCFHCGKKYKVNRKLIAFARHAIDVMREFDKKNSWNYQNKELLLEAEMFSATGKEHRAKVSYNAAIGAARSSKFVHEEGLACELSAIHCIKSGEYNNAANLLEQARECYKKWGARVKVDHITAQLERITATKD